MRHSLIPLVLLLGLPAALDAAAAKQPPRKPNVLFIAIDDLRDWVGYLGNKQVKTPNLDRLAARGVHFTRSYLRLALLQSVARRAADRAAAGHQRRL